MYLDGYGNSKRPKIYSDSPRTFSASSCSDNNLPAFHALTGCDTTSYFFSIGKQKVWSHFTTAIELLKDFGISRAAQTLENVEKLVCSLYGLRERATVNTARALIFRRGKAVEKLPPTSDTLLQHTLRCRYQTAVWQQALETEPQLPPLDGWKLVEGRLRPQLITLLSIPQPTAARSALAAKRAAKCTAAVKELASSAQQCASAVIPSCAKNLLRILSHPGSRLKL